MKRRLSLGLLASIAVASLVSLATTVRVEAAVSQTRKVAGFTRISSDGLFSVDVTAGAGRTNVVVSGDSDVVARVTTEVRDGTLRLGMSGNGLVSHTPKVTIELPALRGFTNSGAGSVTLRGLAGGDIDMTNSGAASIVAAGRAEREKITLAGIGKIDALGVKARDVTVENNGVGSVRVSASGTLNASVNGVGEIRYSGNPAKVESQINGIGRIGRL